MNALALASASLPDHIDIDTSIAADPVPAQRAVRTGLIALAAFALFFVGWSSLSNLDSAVMTQGLVDVEGSRRIVQHPDGGVVRDLLVRDGDTVSRGQPLIRLDTVQLEAALQIQTTAVDTLRATEARLLAEQAGQRRIRFPADLLARRNDPRVAEAIRAQSALFAARREELAGAAVILRQQIAQARTDTAGMASQTRALDQQDKLIADELDGMRELYAKGYATKTRLRALERAAAAIAGQRGEYAGNAARSRYSASQYAEQIAQLHHTRMAQIAEQLDQVQGRLADAVQRQVATRDVLERAVIRAPVAGTVQGLTANTIGGVIGRGMPIMEIVPANERPVVRGRLSPVDGQYVKAGMKAQVRLTGAAGQALPTVDAVVLRRSADLLTQAQTGQNYYAIDVVIPPDQLRRMGTQTLMPGMPISITVPTGERSVLSYLLGPLRQSLDAGLHEQ